MSTGNVPQPNNGVRPLQPQEQPPEWEQLTDIGLCVLVCDCKVKDLLECMLAHECLQKNDGEVASLVEKLAQHWKCDERTQLRKLLNGRHEKKADELKGSFRKMKSLTLHDLQCVVGALDKVQRDLVWKLRDTRNNVVHADYKFEKEGDREDFLDKYKKFIKMFQFQKYFSPHAQAKREECLQLSLKHKELMDMMSEYNNIHKTLEKERAECKERCNQLNEKLEALEVKKDQLQNEVKTLEELLEGEIAERSLLEQQHSEKDKEIDKLNVEKKSVTEQLKKTNEELLWKTDAIKKINKELQMERDASTEKDETISKLDQEMERLKNQADYDSSYITELEDENDDLKEQVETLEDQLSRCRCDVDQIDAQVQTGERVDRRHTF